MERKTFSVIFYLRRARINRDGEAPIVMRITIDGMHADATIKKQSTRKRYLQPPMILVYQ